jgi:hypothetical protein
MSEEKKGIKESSEMIDGLGVLVKAGFKIAKDGKVDLSDLSHLVDVAKEFDTLMEGFKGLDEIDDEVKDLDEAEAIALVAKLFKVIKEAKA